MASSAGLRQRTTGSSPDTSGAAAKSSNPPAPVPSSSRITTFDILRMLAGLALASTIGSYIVTNRTSYTWNLQLPTSLTPKGIYHKARPLLLTNAELAAYDGNDPDKPLLVALNRTIYDVSASRHVYGPGGPYSSLAAKDASRSYITTCFDPKDDLVPYFGGVEEVYVPLWLSKRPKAGEMEAIATGEVMNGMGVEQLMDQVKQKIGRKKMHKLQKEAYDTAKERVKAQVKVWEGMFEKKQYPIVGKVVGVDEHDVSKWASLKFCEAALQQRPSLAESLSKAMEALGHEGGKIDIGKMKRSGAGIMNGKAQQGEYGPEYAQPLQDGGVGGKKFEEEKRKAGIAREKRDKGTDGKQAKDEAKEEIKVGKGAHAAVAGDQNAGNEKDMEGMAAAKLDDMMAGGKYAKGAKA